MKSLMPYQGEFAGYRPLQRIVETERVRKLLARSYASVESSASTRPIPRRAPAASMPPPDLVVGIDGSYAEVDVRNGYPGAMVGYCTVASVLINLKEIERLDAIRPADPRAFRQTQSASTVDAALPGCNVVTRTNHSARASFRESLFDAFQDVVLDEGESAELLKTYEQLLAHKPSARAAKCPYSDDGCERDLEVVAGTSRCCCPLGRPVYSTDALRIHEGFRDAGTNGEALGEVMQIWERIVLVHLLRGLERRNLMGQANRLAFLVDGPLAVFGHPAWLSAAISQELKRLNGVARAATGNDLLVLGIEKSGAFWSHFESLDYIDKSGEAAFGAQRFLMPDDSYIKTRIIYSNSTKRYGLDTYFGRKFFYKTRSGARIVADIPFLTEEQDTLDSDDVSLFPRFGDVCALLDRLVSSRFENSLTPIIAAHAQAAIPLHLGAKVLQQLAQALMPHGGNSA